MPSPSKPLLYNVPDSAASSTLATGLQHLKEPHTQTFVKAVFGGVELAVSGLAALVLAKGLGDGVKEQVPMLERVLQGIVFPLGLIVVYLTGSELFTGYPMWYSLTMLSSLTNPQKHGRLTPRLLLSHLLGPLTCWVGNLVGALFVAYVFSIATGTLIEEPYASGIKEMVKSELVEPAWITIFVRAVGCGWSVCLAMYLGEVGRDVFGRAFGLWLPFFISTTAKWPHTVEYMYIGTLGLYETLRPEGYSLSMFVWKTMLPISLGNVVGGGVLMGGYVWLAYLWKSEKKSWYESMNGGGENGQEDDDEEDED